MRIAAAVSGADGRVLPIFPLLVAGDYRTAAGGVRVGGHLLDVATVGRGAVTGILTVT